MIKESLKPGVSGILRVKDDAEFIELCIESCINALDELVIVYNDCKDNSPEVIEMMRQRYPNKIKVYPYLSRIYALNLSREEYEYALALPDNSPHLLCNYYNFALSKVSYQYALKIDADQIYFTEKLDELCRLARNRMKPTSFFYVLLGMIVFFCYKVSSKISSFTGWLFPSVLFNDFFGGKKNYKSFVNYALWKNASISLSGLNVICNKDKWLVPLGLHCKDFNVMPPFNGAGDHLLFYVSEQCHYEKFVSPNYNQLRNNTYTLIEKFVSPAKIVPAGYYWYHLNMMRKNVYSLNLKLLSDKPERFADISDFLYYSYHYIDKVIDKNICTLGARHYSSFIYSYDNPSLLNNLNLLQSIKQHLS